MASWSLEIWRTMARKQEDGIGAFTSHWFTKQNKWSSMVQQLSYKHYIKAYCTAYTNTTYLYVYTSVKEPKLRLNYFYSELREFN